MTGLGKVVAPDVVNRSHAFETPVKLQLTLRARVPLLPEGSPPVTPERFGEVSRKLVVEPENVGARKRTVPLAVA